MKLFLACALALLATAARAATDHGGPLIARPRIVVVFWGVGVRRQDAVNHFYSAVADSPYLDALAEYGRPGLALGRGSWAGTVTDLDAPAAARLTEAEIEDELDRLIDRGLLPPPDESTLYMVHLPPGASVADDEGKLSCRDWCGEHLAYRRGARQVYFGVLPDLGGACGACVEGGSDFDALTVVASEELIEAMTDAAVHLDVRRADGSTTRAAIVGWLDDGSGLELGDACAPRRGRAAGYAVRQFWSERRRRCVSEP